MPLVMLTNTIDVLYTKLKLFVNFQRIYKLNSYSISRSEAMLNIERVRATFQRQGYNPNSVIRRSEYLQFLNSLLSGESFDEQVAEELWVQACGGENIDQIKVDEICRTIDEGQNVLHQKLNDLEQEIRELENNKQQALRSGVQRDSYQMRQIEEELQEKLEDRAEYTEDLRLVTEPFGVRGGAMSYSRRSGHPYGYGYESNLYSDDGVDRPESQDLKWVLILTLIFGAIQVIIIYGKYDFLNLIVLTCLLSIYLLSHFDQTYVRLTLALLTVSEVLDVIWLFMYASQKWSPPQVGNNSSGQVAYLRFIVFFTICIIALKVPLGYFLFKYRNTSPDNKYTLSMGLFKIVLNANKSNPITRGLKNNLPAQTFDN